LGTIGGNGPGLRKNDRNPPPAQNTTNSAPKLTATNQKAPLTVTSFRIKFLPDEQEVTVEEGQTLLDAARLANVYVGAICNAEGICGKCRVVIREGQVLGESTDFLTRDEIRRGYALACRVEPQSDLVVEVPPESRLGGYEDVGRDSERYRDFSHQDSEPPAAEVDPVVQKHFLTLQEPSVDDPTADHERLIEALAKRQPVRPRMGLKITRELPELLRVCSRRKSTTSWQWDGRVTATVGSRGDIDEVLLVDRGDTSDRNFGLAIDIGTTTVVVHLVDLTSGTTVQAAAKYNSQIEFGADVINRINHARQPGGAETLHRSIIQDIDTLIEDVVTKAQIERDDVLCAVGAGNTTMLHFLLGLEADLLRLSPFIPAITSPGPIRAAEIGLRINPRALFYAMPMVGSYVGGDITAGILASGMYKSEKLSMLMDIGTNGEIVVGNQDFLVACSASAGPAFEGGSISCGMRATSGAIDTVRISPDEISISLTTIDDCPPVGLCGTGLIDALSEMLLAGLVDRNGTLQVDRAPARFQTTDEDGRPRFVLVSAAESGSRRDVTIGQADIENLIRTKGSIFAAADCLMQSVGLSFADLELVYIAGGFGNKLDVTSCINIGLLPDIDPNNIRFIGNSSASGAKMVMLSRAMLEQVHALRDQTTYQELMVDPAYMERFTSACFLPHTDLSQFPSVAARIDGRGSQSANESDTV
jgi:uncharacterized 2Fe-2S/4Fe-4S cluster protein (DUF4445 family)